MNVARSRRRLHSLGIEDRVVLMDGISELELSGLYTCCEMLVYPSLYEGFGLPVLEAMVHGAPVACSRTSSIPEVGGEAVLYFDPMDAGQIADCMHRLLTDQRVAAELRRLGPKRAALFSWDRAAREVLAFASTLLEHR